MVKLLYLDMSYKTVSILYLLCVCVTGNSLEKIPLNFSYITTISGGATGFVSSGSIPVVDLALEQINNSTDILSNYTLEYTTILDNNVSYLAPYNNHT